MLKPSTSPKTGKSVSNALEAAHPASRNDTNPKKVRDSLKKASASSATAKDVSPTPMLKQYHAVKTKHKDCILLFRLGDFYEMFYEDAKIVARALDLVLTSRGKTPQGKIPMCGFPHHAADNYIARLIKKGHKVAICEQLEDPALAKGIVKRDVTRIITSGTFLDEAHIDSRFLISLNLSPKTSGVAFTDPATGTIQTNQYPFNARQLIALMARLPIYECLFPESQEDQIKKLFKHPLLQSKNITLSSFEDWSFNPDIAQKSLCEHFHVHNLNGFGLADKSFAVSSTGALLEYLKQMNKQPLEHIDRISLYTDDDYVFISPAAHAGLEMESFLKSLDHTLTPLGKRKLRFWVFHPLKDPDAIRQRQEAVGLLKSHSLIQKELQSRLSRLGDLEKNISRLSCGYTHAKDLLAIRNALALIPDLQKIVQPLQKNNPLFALDDLPVLREYLFQTINEDVPLSNPDGKVIKKGYHQELDSLRELQENGRLWLKNFQANEIKRTGINSLKVGYNKVFGYYIEVTKTHLKSVTPDYIRKQTLVNAERFITPELKEYEQKILTAEEKILKIENILIQEVKTKILEHVSELHLFCQQIATLDVILSLHTLAQRPNYIVPTISDDSVLDIRDGRHPMVEQTILENFVPNDTLLDCEGNHLIILTGPNMSGKSTYIRQNALLVILAQMGSFIPARSAHIGIVDKIFTRIGAHDDITRGQSTFMVEMNETADILNNLSERSLVILDEIGRGTSTYDGLSLAWALAEHLKETRARTLFATHFHELTALADENEGVKNYNVAVKEWKDEIIFLHKIIPGGTDDSYGIYVAKLAGIPNKVIRRAKQILTQLELKNDIKDQLRSQLSRQEQITLFAQHQDPVLEEIIDIIQAMDVDQLTPIEALNKMQELKEKMK